MGLFFANANLPVPAIPTIGVGLHWYYQSVSAVSLYSDHPSGSIFVPCFKSTGEAVIVEVKSAQLPMSCDLSTSGAGGLDTGSVAASKFYCIRMIAKADGGDPVLLATLNAGTPTIPTAYQGGLKSEILWGVSCSTDISPPYDTFDDIQSFIQTAPGVCQYQTGYASNPGYGISILTDGDATASTAVDFSHCAPSPVAGSGRESIGEATLFVHADNISSNTKSCLILYSADGRDDTDGEESMTVMHRLGPLDNLSAQGPREESELITFPLALSATTTDYGFSSNSTGTLANCLQYSWSGGASCKLDLYVQGWSIRG